MNLKQTWQEYQETTTSPLKKTLVAIPEELQEEFKKEVKPFRTMQNKIAELIFDFIKLRRNRKRK